MKINDNPEYWKERIRLMRVQADRIELKNQVMRRELLPVAEVRAEWSEGVSNIRQKLLGLGVKVAPVLEGKSLREMVRVIDAEVRELLNELAEEYR